MYSLVLHYANIIFYLVTLLLANFKICANKTTDTKLALVALLLLLLLLHEKPLHYLPFAHSEPTRFPTLPKTQCTIHDETRHRHTHTHTHTQIHAK